MKERREYKGFQVLKHTLKGKLVKTYPSQSVAKKAEDVSLDSLKAAIKNGTPLKNHKFSTGFKRDNISSLRALNPFPWEGKDGMFNEKGWAKATW